MMESYIALDLETTGLDAKQEKITEIAAIKIVNGVPGASFVTFVNPGRSLGEHITRLTGITDQMLKDAPPIEEVIGEAVKFFGELPLLGHNIMFDYSFLKQAAVNSSLDFEKEGLDTLMLCRSFMPADVKRNLSCACSYYHISQSEAHRAQADAQAAHMLYQELIRRHSRDRPELFAPKPLIYKAKREQPATKRQKEYLRDLIKCHRIDVTVQVDDISRNQASRMIDTIISQYGRIPWKSLGQDR